MFVYFNVEGIVRFIEIFLAEVTQRHLTYWMNFPIIAKTNERARWLEVEYKTMFHVVLAHDGQPGYRTSELPEFPIGGWLVALSLLLTIIQCLSS